MMGKNSYGKNIKKTSQFHPFDKLKYFVIFFIKKLLSLLFFVISEKFTCCETAGFSSLDVFLLSIFILFLFSILHSPTIKVLCGKFQSRGRRQRDMRLNWRFPIQFVHTLRIRKSNQENVVCQAICDYCEFFLLLYFKLRSINQDSRTNARGEKNLLRLKS